MASINPVLTAAGNRAGTTIRDYRHAARVFTDGQFRLSPKYGFLFYVEFDFNPDITSVSNTAAQEMGMIVKSVQLPKFTLDTKTHNAYNRVNLVQNKIKYDPVVIAFHDDQADNVRNFWYDYYSFFFRDPDYADVTYSSPHKYQTRPSFDWGYSPRPTAGYPTSNRFQPYQYIQAIRIYSLYQKNFSEYQLVNPLITQFRHGDHSNDGAAPTMAHEMTIAYETVKYLTGYTTYNTVGGYIDLHYDNTPSPLAPKDGTDLIANGQGGYTRVPDTITDLAGTGPNFVNELGGGINTSSSGFGGGFGDFGAYKGISFGALSGATTLLTSSTLTNIGGFTIPSAGRAAINITNRAILERQLTTGATNIVGGLVNSAANGLIGGFTKGLGPTGNAAFGLLVTAIANPKVLAATAINMAATAGMNYIGEKISQYTQPLIDQAGRSVAEWTSQNIGQPLEKAWGDIVTNFDIGTSYISAQLWGSDYAKSLTYDQFAQGYYGP